MNVQPTLQRKPQQQMGRKFSQAVDQREKTDVYCKASLMTAMPQGKQLKSGKWAESSR
jgi:hypothetical protein